MEHMNKQQIILLALLVSFVSSIATGISVVSLMQQDQSIPVTQTINNVIERTIEKVSTDSGAKPSVVTKETIVVKEDEAVADAIELASKGIVKIFSIDYGSTERFVGIGVIASSSGKIIAKTEVNYSGSYVGLLSGGNKVPLSFVSYDASHGLSIFQAEQSSIPSDARVYSAVSFADSKAIKLGQSIVLISNRENTSVATGIISSFDPNESTVRTSVRGSDFQDQAILINLSGEVLGIKDLDAFDGGFITDSIMKTYATP